MVKNYLNKSLLILGLLIVVLAKPVLADESYSSLFVKITDASTAVKQKEQEKAKQLVGEIKTEFDRVANHDSAAGQEVSKALDLSGQVTEEKLTKISSALLKFEKASQ